MIHPMTVETTTTIKIKTHPGGRFAAFFFTAVLGAACVAPGERSTATAGSFDGIETGRIRAHTAYLADDLLEGRLPGARGGALAAKYLAAQAEALGLAPGNGNSYYQNVPLVGIETNRGGTITLDAPGNPSMTLQYLDDFVGADETLHDKTRFEAACVFVGYGIVAPELNWNDYEGVDVRGKVVVILANEPGHDDPNATIFGGRALTYYGRWTYKFEEAARRGAAGALLIHTDASAGYNWTVVRNSWGRERPYPVPDGAHALSAACWITNDAATKAFHAAGLDLPGLRARAGKPGFRPIQTPLSATFDWTAGTRPIATQNVVAVVPGSDPVLKNEYIIYTAHYDHLGIVAPENGDSICNGAVDNAGGCATVLEIARCVASGPRPRRSVMFAWVTAEEGGLRGSEYFASHPTVPAGSIIANINIDGIPLSGDPQDVSPLGGQRSTLEAVITKEAERMQLNIVGDRDPSQGYFFRSDHFSFAKTGVPAVNVGLGYNFHGQTEAAGREREQNYRRDRYHRPADQMDPAWDFVAPARLGQFCMRLGLALANSTFRPEYKPGDEFAKRR